jgi:hypothetical protein
LSTFLLAGDFAPAILDFNFCTFKASTLTVTLATFLDAYLSVTLALTILALIAALNALGASFNFFLRALIFFAILS